MSPLAPVAQNALPLPSTEPRSPVGVPLAHLWMADASPLRRGSRSVRPAGLARTTTRTAVSARSARVFCVSQPISAVGAANSALHTRASSAAPEHAYSCVLLSAGTLRPRALNPRAARQPRTGQPVHGWGLRSRPAGLHSTVPSTAALKMRGGRPTARPALARLLRARSGRPAACARHARGARTRPKPAAVFDARVRRPGAEGRARTHACVRAGH
jgi:hypothetical protein